MTRIDLISGFLGAGKTTWIKRWVTHPLYAAFVDTTFIIENEFGEVSIDPTLLKQSQLKVSELSAGCICCSIVGDFTKHLEQLIETYQPSRIIIEPTGVAKLSEVLEACKTLHRKGTASIGQAVTLIDATQAHLYIENFGDFYLDQIKHAHQLVLTKTNNLSSEDLKALKQLLESHNPTATQLIGSDLADEAVSMAMDLNFDPFPKRDVFQIAHKAHAHDHDHVHSAHHTFESLGYISDTTYSYERLTETIHALFEEPLLSKSIIRAKGLFQTPRGGIKFDYAGQSLTFESCPKPQQNMCCFIGTHLDNHLIEDKLKPLEMTRTRI